MPRFGCNFAVWAANQIFSVPFLVHIWQYRCSFTACGGLVGLSKNMFWSWLVTVQKGTSVHNHLVSLYKTNPCKLKAQASGISLDLQYIFKSCAKTDIRSGHISSYGNLMQCQSIKALGSVYGSQARGNEWELLGKKTFDKYRTQRSFQNCDLFKTYLIRVLEQECGARNEHNCFYSKTWSKKRLKQRLCRFDNKI